MMAFKNRVLSGSEINKAYLALFAVYLAWGTTFGAMHIGLSDFPPFVFACQRFLIAGVLMIGFCLLKGEALPSAFAVKRNVITGTLMFACSNAVAFWTLQYFSTGFAGLMVALHPFWMVALTAILPPRETVKPMALLGLMVGFMGLSILLLPELTRPQAYNPMLLPCVLITLCTGLTWALGSIYMRKNPVSSSVLMSVGLQNLSAGLILIPVNLLMGNNPLMATGVHGLAALIYLVVVGSLIGMTCYQYMMEKLPVPISSTFAYVTPLITITVGWLILGESVSPMMLLGGLIILAGVYIVQTVSHKKLQPQLQTLKSA